MTEIKSSRKNITLSRFQEKDGRRYRGDAQPPAGLTAVTTVMGGAGCSSVDSVPAFEAVGRRIDPSQWTQLQFGLFSVPTSVPQLVYQSMYCSVYGKVHIKDPLLLIEKSSLCVAAAGFLLKSVSTWPYEWRPITDDKIKINVFQWRR